MLTKEALSRIRKRFVDAEADEPMRIEGDHLKKGVLSNGPHRCGWRVLSAKGHGVKSRDGTKEFDTLYADGTTFEAATFLVHLPVDIPRMLDDLDQLYLVLEGMLVEDEEAIEWAKRQIKRRAKG